MNITHYKAQLWAKDHNTYVFKWKSHAGKEENRPEESKMKKIKEKIAIFWQFWILHAPFNLTISLNPGLALVKWYPNSNIFPYICRPR